MGGRKRTYTILVISCIFLSLLSWANKYRLSADRQVRASRNISRQPCSGSPPNTQLDFAPQLCVSSATLLKIDDPFWRIGQAETGECATYLKAVLRTL